MDEPGTDGLLYRTAARIRVPRVCRLPARPAINLETPGVRSGAYGGPSERASNTNDPPCGLKYNEYSLPRACQVIMY